MKFDSEQKSTVYICHTVYHVYITALKACRHNSELFDVLLVDTVPDVDDLAVRLRASGLFGQVLVCGVGRPFKSRSYYGVYARLLLGGRKNNLFYERLDSYERIFLFNDLSGIAAMLHFYKREYHLIEDGLDCFKVINQDNAPFVEGLLQKVLIFIFDLPTRMAVSDYCVDVEINDENNLLTAISRPVIVQPRSELLDGVDADGAKKLVSIFLNKDVSYLEGGVLIMTSPLTELGVSRERQISYYKKLLEMFSEYRCFIKPHPRDTLDFSELEQEALVLDRRVPVEIFSIQKNFRMHAVVSYMSTAMGSIDFAEEKFITKSGMQIAGVSNLDLEP